VYPQSVRPSPDAAADAAGGRERAVQRRRGRGGRRGWKGADAARARPREELRAAPPPQGWEAGAGTAATPSSRRRSGARNAGGRGAARPEERSLSHWDPLPRRRGRCGQPVAAPHYRSCGGGERRALCRRSLRRSPQRCAGAPRPALVRRHRCKRASGAAVRSMDGTVSLAPGPAAPASVRLDPAAALAVALPRAPAGSSGCGTSPPGHCPPPAAPPDRARTPGTGAVPAPALPAGHARPGGWQSPGSGPRAARITPGGAPLPRRSAAAPARLLRGAGDWNTPTLSPFFPSGSALRPVQPPTWPPAVVPARASAPSAELCWLCCLARTPLAWRGRQREEAQYSLATPKCRLQAHSGGFPSAGTGFPRGDTGSHLKSPSLPWHGPLESRVLFLTPCPWRQSTPQCCPATK